MSTLYTGLVQITSGTPTVWSSMTNPTRTLYPHQEKALRELSNGKILCGGVGSGKSMVAVAYYMKYEQPKDVYVITTAKKRDDLDWHGEFVKYGVYTYVSTEGKLTVESWNNIAKFKDVKDAFFIFDEQRLVGSGTWVRAFLKIARENNWILLSATPGDNWMDYIPVFLANGYYRNRTEFKEQHVIYEPYVKFPKVKGYKGVQKLLRHRMNVLVDMPYERHTTRHTIDVDVSYDSVAWKTLMKTRWNPYEDKPIESAPEMGYLMRRVVTSDKSRLDAVREVMEKHPRLIIFYNYNYELELLRDYLDSLAGTDGIGSIYREWNGQKHEGIPDQLKWVYLVQYTAGAEGWNCIETDAMLFYSLTYSYKQFEQAYGRIDRLNTPFSDLYYYVLKSKDPMDRAVQNAQKLKKDFNLRRFMTKTTY